MNTPLVAHFKLNASMYPSSNNEIQFMANVSYANAVGSLTYMMVCTRPDISHAVSIVSRYMHAPEKEHWNAIKWILRYLLRTIDVGLESVRDITITYAWVM